VLEKVLDSGPPVHNRAEGTDMDGYYFDVEVDWCDYDEVMAWWAKVEYVLSGDN